MEVKHLFDIVEHYVKTKNTTIVFFRNQKLERSDDVQKINEVWEYYKEHLNDVVYYAITHSEYNIIEFMNVDSAIEFIEDNFPRRDQVPELIYWFHCSVFDPNGVMVYENEALKPGLNRPSDETEEGLTGG